MFNYNEVDKYPTLEVYAKLIPLLYSKFPNSRRYMIKSIIRVPDTDNQYLINFTEAQNGFSPTVKLTDDVLEVVHSGSVWMS